MLWLEIALGIWVGFVLIALSTWAFCQVHETLRQSRYGRRLYRSGWL